MDARAPGSFDEAAWAGFLSEALGARVAVRFGRARSSVLRALRPRRGELVVHMNACFARAPRDVRASVARWLARGRGARAAARELDSWIDAELSRAPRAPLDPARLRPRGARVDLRELVRELVAGELAGELGGREPPAITFGREDARGVGRAGRRARRSLRLGSYDPHAHLVRIHPALDRDFVPRWFVRAIVFHELLHAAIPLERRADGRRVFHGPRFRARERAYADHRRALAWERENLERLLAPPRRDRALRDRRAPAAAWRAVQGWLFPARAVSRRRR